MKEKDLTGLGRDELIKIILGQYSKLERLKERLVGRMDMNTRNANYAYPLPGRDSMYVFEARTRAKAYQVAVSDVEYFMNEEDS